MKKKECLFLTEANIAHDGRTVELLNVMKSVCNTTLVCFDSYEYRDFRNNHMVNKAKGPLRRIRSTLRLTSVATRNVKEILFVDNSKACIDAFLLLMRKRIPIVILDTRELYLKGEQRSWQMKVICWFERRLITKANFIIAANESRALYMKDYYNLKDAPIWFENIRKLSEQPQKIDELVDFIQDKSKILSFTGGLMKDREVPLIEALKNLDSSFKLVIAGRCTDEEKKHYIKAIKEAGLENRVLYLGELNRDKLKYLIQKTYIGFVYYEGKNVNEKYCASGKIYEYMFEGIPFASPCLISHMNLESKYGICACDDDLSLAVKKIDKDYTGYQERVNTYIANISEEKNRSTLAEKIEHFIYQSSAADPL